MSPENKDQTPAGDGQKQTQPEGEAKPILGRFKSEDEANDYISQLEARAGKQEDADMKSILDFKRDSGHEDRQPAGTPKPETDEEKDLQDASVIQTYPGFQKYIKAAHAEVARNPGMRLITAFKSVYEPLVEMKNISSSSQETDEERTQKKRLAQVERSQPGGSDLTASKDDVEKLKEVFGYAAPGSQNEGRRV